MKQTLIYALRTFMAPLVLVLFTTSGFAQGEATIKYGEDYLGNPKVTIFDMNGNETTIRQSPFDSDTYYSETIPGVRPWGDEYDTRIPSVLTIERDTNGAYFE